MTDQEIRQLALDIHGGRVFTHWQIPKGDDLAMVFMCLALMDEKTYEAFRKDEPGLIYEYMSKALPRSINGMPIFMSMHFLNVADTQRLDVELKKLTKFVETGETNVD